MTPEEILNHLSASGLTVTLDKNDLIITPPGHLTPDFRQILKTNKARIVALLQYRKILAQLQEIESRPLTDDEKAAIDSAFTTLRNEHGPALHAAGWIRSVIFDGLDPTKCEIVGDVPGIIGLLMAGGRLVKIHPDRLDLEFPDESPFSKIRGGVMIGGTELERYLTDLQSTERKNHG